MYKFKSCGIRIISIAYHCVLIYSNELTIRKAYKVNTTKLNGLNIKNNIIHSIKREKRLPSISMCSATFGFIGLGNRKLKIII